MAIVSKINTQVLPIRTELVKQSKWLMGYIIVGLVLVSIMATVLGIYVSYIVSIIFIALYFVGLFIMIKCTNRKIKELEKHLVFNLAISCTIINKDLAGDYRIKVRVGHLGQWLEFHSLKRDSMVLAQKKNGVSTDIQAAPIELSSSESSLNEL